MTRLDDLAKPPAVRDAPSSPRAATPGNSIPAWATSLVLALLAIWPAVALVRAARSPEFAPSVANLIVAFAALVLIALAVVAAQPSDRNANLTLAAVACFGAFLVGDCLLGWNQRSLRSGTRSSAHKDANLATVRRELSLPDLASLTTDADVLRVFKAILSAAERRVRSWGGDLYFVMIPNQDDYRGKIPPYRRAVLDVVQQIGLPVVDLDRPLRASGDPLQFYPLRTAWGHFNPEGYKLFAYSLIDAMVERRQLAADPIALEELDPGNRRLTKVNALVAALRRLNPGLSSDALLPLIRGQAIQTQRHDYRPYAGVTKVLEDDGRATVDSGVAMYGATFQPKEAGNLLRVRVHVNGYSEGDNRLAIGLFMDADNKPRAIASKPVAAKSTSVVDLEYDMLLTNLSPRAIQIRIGPARPGQIFVNGDAKGANGKAPPAFIEFTESRAVGD